MNYPQRSETRTGPIALLEGWWSGLAGGKSFSGGQSSGIQKSTERMRQSVMAWSLLPTVSKMTFQFVSGLTNELRQGLYRLKDAVQYGPVRSWFLRQDGSCEPWAFARKSVSRLHRSRNQQLEQQKSIQIFNSW